MLKYDKNSTAVCFEEIPECVSLGISITNCAGTCEGCHSPWLREDIGNVLDEPELDKLINDNSGINCVLFMGEGRDVDTLLRLSDYVRRKYGLKTALYSGRSVVKEDIYYHFDYVKVGPYIANYGPLNMPTTNQRLYKIGWGEDGNVVKEDITCRFWRTME